MYLITAATTFEMQPFLKNFSGEGIDTLITGVGPVETTVRLMAFLGNFSGTLEGVVNFGIGGVYVHEQREAHADILDICIADTEVLGDFGVCLADRIEPITGKELEVPRTFTMDKDLRERAAVALHNEKISFVQGNFVTVNCTTGTAKRGVMLERQYSGLCENMEGAAVARVCQQFDLPCLEIRCISNLVEDRNTKNWKLKQACKRSGEITAKIVHHLLKKSK